MWQHRGRRSVDPRFRAGLPAALQERLRGFVGALRRETVLSLPNEWTAVAERPLRSEERAGGVARVRLTGESGIERTGPRVWAAFLEAEMQGVAGVVRVCFLDEKKLFENDRVVDEEIDRLEAILHSIASEKTEWEVNLAKTEETKKDK